LQPNHSIGKAVESQKKRESPDSAKMMAANIHSQSERSMVTNYMITNPIESEISEVPSSEE
jgi:hypothetical protein